jgi:hypothetical protein
MTSFQPYPDIEDAIRGILLRDFASDLPSAPHVGVDWPASDAVLPFVRVEKVAPSRRTRLNDYPSVDIEVLAATRGGAKTLIERIDAHLLDYPQTVTITSGRVVLDMVTVPIPPRAMDWDSPNVRRYAGTYQFSVRR